MTDTMRKEYRVLSDEEKARMQKIKDMGEAMLAECQVPVGREMALARTKIEEAVMWAVKAITG